MLFCLDPDPYRFLPGSGYAALVGRCSGLTYPDEVKVLEADHLGPGLLWSHGSILGSWGPQPHTGHTMISSPSNVADFQYF